MAEYIEREALYEEIKSLSVFLGGDNVFNKTAKETVLKIINEKPTADVVEIDKFASKIAGHSYYHGDKILARLYCLKEGQKIEESIEPADVVEVVHGEWINKNWLYRCSECDSVCPYDIEADVYDLWTCHYCPNCGAKMDGGKA